MAASPAWSWSIQLATKFVHGAWIAVTAIIIFFVLMRGVRRHYDRVSVELVPSEDEDMLPSRNHAIVLVSKIHKPTLRALAYARATRPSTLVALTVQVDEDETEGAAGGMGAPRDPRTPGLARLALPRDHPADPRRTCATCTGDSPRDVVTVFLPEYVVGHWWEHLLHNQSALRLKTRLLFTPGVMVTSVPWQLSLLGPGERDPCRGAAAAPGRRPLGFDSPEPRTPTRTLRLVPAVGDTLELEVGPVAHGGFCVARHDGQAVFVRHSPAGRAGAGHRHRGPAALPAGRRGRGADAVGAPRRGAVPVRAPRRLRRLRLAARRAGAPARAQGRGRRGAAVPPRRARPRRHGARRCRVGADGLGWRTRVGYAVRRDGTVGLHKARSHAIQPIDRCLIAHPAVTELGVERRQWPYVRAVEAVASVTTPDRLVAATPVSRRQPLRPIDPRRAGRLRP